MKNEEVDMYSGGFYLAVEGKKIKLILDEPLPKSIEVAMRGKPYKISGKQNSFVIEWSHRIPVQVQPHIRKESTMKEAQELIEEMLEGKSAREVVAEAFKGKQKDWIAAGFTPKEIKWLKGYEKRSGVSLYISGGKGNASFAGKRVAADFESFLKKQGFKDISGKESAKGSYEEYIVSFKSGGNK